VLITPDDMDKAAKLSVAYRAPGKWSSRPPGAADRLKTFDMLTASTAPEGGWTMRRQNLSPRYTIAAEEMLQAGIWRVAFMSHRVCMNKTRDRLTSVTIAVLLQMGFVTIFIYSLPLISPPKNRAHEITFILPRLREAPKTSSAPRRITPSASLPILNSQRPTLPPIAMPPPTTDLQAFGKALFGCAPENLGNLTPEQRTHCSGFGTAPHGAAAATQSPSLINDLPRREAELAARNTPTRVPCTSLRTQTFGFSSNVTTAIVDPLCALNGWLNGFGGLPP
jgi:hypothetical protein